MDKKLMELSKQLKESNRPPFLTQEEFDDLIESMPSADFDIFDDRQDGEHVCSTMCAKEGTVLRNIV